MIKTVLITGANRGIGFAFAKAYLKRGWKVYAACRDVRSGEDLKALAQTNALQPASSDGGFPDWL